VAGIAGPVSKSADIMVSDRQFCADPVTVGSSRCGDVPEYRDDRRPLPRKAPDQKKPYSSKDVPAWCLARVLSQSDRMYRRALSHFAIKPNDADHLRSAWPTGRQRRPRPDVPDSIRVHQEENGSPGAEMSSRPAMVCRCTCKSFRSLRRSRRVAGSTAVRPWPHRRCTPNAPFNEPVSGSRPADCRER
jgi:hypothetical protein